MIAGDAFRKRLRQVGSIVALAMLSCASVAQTDGTTGTTREIMHGVYDAIAYLLPLSVRDPEARSGWDQQLIHTKLNELQTAADELAAHGRDNDREFALLANSFDEVTTDITKAFKEEWPEYAYFALVELTQHCVACHSRLPAESQPMFAQRLLSRVDVDRFEPAALVQLYVATRQFDAAARTIERELMAPGASPLDADYSGRLVDYLRVAIAVREDLQRPRTFLSAYLQRPDVPLYLEQRISFWIDALETLAPTLNGAATLESALATLTVSDDLSRAPGNHLRAVHDLVAANLLRRYLSDHPGAAGTERAQAYYNLGVISLRSLEPKLAVPEMEFLLTAAIEAAPGTATARNAYLLLEEYGYVRGYHLADPAVRQTLIDMPALRKLAGFGPA